eukprot:489226-Pelagomonas_calceolata.AAC.2
MEAPERIGQASLLAWSCICRTKGICTWCCGELACMVVMWDTVMEGSMHVSMPVRKGKGRVSWLYLPTRAAIC